MYPKQPKNQMSLVVIRRQGFFGELPNEITEEIIMTNEKWAIEIIQKKTKLYKQKKIAAFSGMLEFCHTIGTETPNQSLVEKNVAFFYGRRQYKKDDVLKVFATCRCCDRHQINKPNKLEKWEELPTNWDRPEIKCFCKCRHHGRWLCR